VSTIEFVIRLVDALAWPVVVLVAVVLLRRPVSELLTRHPPASLRAGPLELTWSHVVAETSQQAAKVERTSAELDSTRPGRVAEELAPAVEKAPLTAIREAYATLERTLREVVGPVEGVDTYRLGPVSLAKLGASRGVIDQEIVRTVEGLMIMHNMAIHNRGPAITPDRAREYVSLADITISALTQRA
jgi:hypothetical protein